MLKCSLYHNHAGCQQLFLGGVMTLARTAQRRDANEPEIVDALVALGCSVDRVPGGDGRMDLLIGFKGHDIKMEIKMPGEKLNPKQKTYHAEWKGSPIYLAHTAGEAIAIVCQVAKRRLVECP